MLNDVEAEQSLASPAERPIHLAARELSTPNVRVLYRGFPPKLHHAVPNWVPDGALFHIRIALNRTVQQRALTEPALGQLILDSVQFYHEKERWFVTLFLLMPDHLHMLVSFCKDQGMSRVMGEWKHFHARQHEIIWQEGYFDHRFRY